MYLVEKHYMQGVLTTLVFTQFLHTLNLVLNPKF